MKSILLIGLGRFGVHIAKKLDELGHEVMAIDKDEEKIDAILPIVTNAQIGDCTNKEFLRSLGVDNYDVCIVAIAADFQSSLETTWILKELGAKLVVARADRDIQEKILLRNGADKVVYPEKQMAIWTAVCYSSEHIFDYIPLDEEHAIFEVDVPRNWAGKAIGQIDIRKKYNINIMAVKQGGELNMRVTSDTVLEEGQNMLVLGNSIDIQKCFVVHNK